MKLEVLLGGMAMGLVLSRLLPPLTVSVLFGGGLLWWVQNEAREEARRMPSHPSPLVSARVVGAYRPNPRVAPPPEEGREEGREEDEVVISSSSPPPLTPLERERKFHSEWRGQASSHPRQMSVLTANRLRKAVLDDFFPSTIPSLPSGSSTA